MTAKYQQDTVETGIKIMIESMVEAGVTPEQIEQINIISQRKWEEATLIMKAGML